ncbi:MAG TPA: porphobilinogen synthase [Coxiellaceae bacterium]|nr:porphobilinogen synthase [Coxiellaceae bacterium]
MLPTTRLRRLRAHPKLRELVRNTLVTPQDLVYPLFIKEGLTEKVAIGSMPGCYQFDLKSLVVEIKSLQELKIPAVILFGIPLHKDAKGSASLVANGIVQEAIKVIKDVAPELLVITDLCFCEYTDHGHCGVVAKAKDGFKVDNDKTLELLAAQAVSHAEAGADVIAPSGMMDCMVHAIREGLDTAGFNDLAILSYAVKYASALYGPFREAAEGVPQFGDRKTYQMDPANTHEALREVDLDIAEGADMLMVKPALSYLDIITKVKQHYPEVPLGAYQVSGEYAMIKAAAEKGWINEQAVMLESLTSIKRAGADFILTYFAKDVAKLF